MSDNQDPIEGLLEIIAFLGGLAMAAGTVIGVLLLTHYAYTEASWFGIFALFFGGGTLLLGAAGTGIVFYDGGRR